MNKKSGPKICFSLAFIVALTLSLLPKGQAIAQTQIGFRMPEGVNKTEIKFEKLSNLIVIPVTLNNSITVKFILDTGAESVIVTEKLFADILGLDFVREINIFGPGIIDSVKAFVATNATLSLPNGVIGDGLNLLVLEKDYLELHKNLGEEVYGILGYDFFKRFVVEIDYDEQLLTLYRPEIYRPKKSFSELDISIRDTKPYIISKFSQDDKSDTVRMMVDTGASHAVLLDMEATDHLVLPERVEPTRLGRGLGGEIQGYIGRLDECGLGDFSFENVLISIPQQGAYTQAIKRGSRHGTIGGDLLSRFDVVFDYRGEKMYLRKGKYYSYDFEYNMSGMSVLSDGVNLDSIIVIEVVKDTPAHKADIRRGDKILKVNGYQFRDIKISEINTLLRKKHGMKVRMIILREGDRIKKEFRLERLI